MSIWISPNGFYLPVCACIKRSLVECIMKALFQGFDERTGVLIGLWSSSLLQRTGKGSRGASNESGGES